ncbi:hypothetical protein B0H13DRAFT_1612394, partial [Mycena leptocephala]
IWKSIRHRDIGRNIRNLLWKSMHGAHRLGKWWLNIPECEERSNCVHCGAEETLNHILLECPCPGQSEVWKLAEKEPSWPEVSMGTIVGSGLAVFKDDSEDPRPALARLYKILMTESAHVIWKLRCDSVIGREGTPPSTHEIPGLPPVPVTGTAVFLRLVEWSPKASTGRHGQRHGRDGPDGRDGLV